MHCGVQQKSSPDNYSAGFFSAVTWNFKAKYFADVFSHRVRMQIAFSMYSECYGFCNFYSSISVQLVPKVCVLTYLLAC